MSIERKTVLNLQRSENGEKPMNRCQGVALLVVCAMLRCGERNTRTSPSVGVAECDEYVAKMNACIERDPRMKAMGPGFRAQQDAWKQLAKTDAASAQANCKMALASLAATPSCR